MSFPNFKALRLDRMSRDFGAFNALKDISLSVGRGEFIALLGPSGCGKSTALNCLAGLLPLTGGSIWLDEKRIDTLGPEDRGFGMVFQNYALFPHMTVRGNVGFGLRMKRRPRAEITKRVDEALRLVRLSAQADKLPGQISGGQQQRVAIARAIVVEPPLVLMDEPLSNLDAKLRLEMRAEIRRIHNLLGCATIYVTHDQDEALSLADRIVVLRDGEVRQIGTPETLYARPADPDVAEFMGYRNIVHTHAAAAGNLVRVGVGAASIDGTPVAGMVDGPAIVAIRPDDLVPHSQGEISATVRTAEYRGRDFYGVATTGEGIELYFRSESRVQEGEALRLGADPASVLVYAGHAA
jgi:putative spermidine/putrescine transport system ATP-binding protein